MRVAQDIAIDGGACGGLPVAAFGRASPAASRGDRIIICLECGGPGRQAGENTREFCCDQCRRAWHARREKRGAELYDFVMAMRYERGLASRLVIGWALICRLAAAYRASDETARQGRRSWRRPGVALESLPSAYGRAGDGR